MDIVWHILSCITIKHSVKTKHKNSIHNLSVKVDMLSLLAAKALQHNLDSFNVVGVALMTPVSNHTYSSGLSSGTSSSLC